MTNNKLSDAKYRTMRSIYICLIILIWFTGIIMTVGQFIFDISNAQSGYVLLAFFVLLISTAFVNQYYNVPFKEYRLSKLRSHYHKNGLIIYNNSLSKQELINKVTKEEFKKINNTTFGFNRKSIFNKVVYIITIKEYKRFKKFNESDKLHSKILKTFSLSQGSIYRNVKIKSFEIAILEEVCNEDIDNYINECTLSTVHKLNETGVLYDKNAGKIYFCDSKQRDFSNRFISLIESQKGF